MTDGLTFGLGILLGVTVAGVALVAYWISQRYWGQIDEPDAEPKDAAEIAALFAALPQSHIVLDADNTVLRASSITFAYNLVRNGQLRDELRELADVARREGRFLISSCGYRAVVRMCPICACGCELPRCLAKTR